ncbi:MAG: hypothetical protein RRC07_17920 [Anaerolineae bacterium]|nr:hypothetical protein [Anaerolineae bacterium]
MMNWIRSSRGALALSFAALLSLLARSYYDIRYILTEEYSQLSPQMDVLWFLGFTAIVGANVAALLAAGDDRRGGWIALLAFNLAIGLGCGIGSLLAFTSSVLELLIFTASLITGILAAVAVGLQLRKPRDVGKAVAIGRG